MKSSSTSLSALRKAWSAFAEANPGTRSREVAQALGCSEADLVATGRGALSVTWLDSNRMTEWLEVVARQEHWMWLVRNEWAVLERDVDNLRPADETLAFRDAATTVALARTNASNFICLLTEPEQRLALSVQIFDARGQAVLKIYLKSRRLKDEALERLRPFCASVGDDLLASQTAAKPAGPQLPPLPAGGRSVEKSLASELIELARDRGVSVRLSVANTGARMSVDHLPQDLRPMEAWFNIMDRGFNLHLKDNELARTRLVGADEVLVAQLLSATGEEVLRLELPASLADAAEALI